nr:hypothetical protein GCM10025699_68550 [Microbacterium flavescens]
MTTIATPVPATMHVATVTGPGTVDLVEAPVPTPGPTDVLVRVRACGICGSDGFYVSLGGLPGLEGRTPSAMNPPARSSSSDPTSRASRSATTWW